MQAAIDRGEQAVAATPDHPDRGVYLSNLALAYRERFHRCGEPADLVTAIEYGERAVVVTP